MSITLQRPRAWLLLLLVPNIFVAGQQECYFGPGAENRGPSNLVPCVNDGTSACCLLGDTCLAGSTCYNYLTGNLYQYGCTDITYEDPVCPYKCGWNTSMMILSSDDVKTPANLDKALSPWVGLEYCDEPDVSDTWTCEAPESCGCEWNATYDLLVLPPQACSAMGTNARLALHAPSVIVPYVSLPSTIGGSTGYYSPTSASGMSTTWVSTAVAGCKIRESIRMRETCTDPITYRHTLVYWSLDHLPDGGYHA